MALIMVLGALVLIAIVAGRFATRIDELRRQATSLREHAQQRVQAGNALSAALYAMSTLRLGPAGFGIGMAPDLYADDRVYALPDGGLVRVQDQRGLYPLNAADPATLGPLLQALGTSRVAADAMVDVLLDYTDTDGLKQLNGAEGREYAALALPPPRNDWLLSVRELYRMPGWRERPEVIARMEALASTARRPVLNPNTAPIELLAALWPTATPEQLDLLRTWRERAPFRSAEEAQRVTGLPLVRDEYVFHVGPEMRLTVSARGSPRALQYNVSLLPAGPVSPWLITNVEPETSAGSRDALPDRADPFPLAFPAASDPGDMASAGR